MDKKHFLKENFFLFKDLSEEEINDLICMDGIDEEFFSVGKIMQDCSRCEKIGIIVKGKAIIKSDENGVIIRKLFKNDIYGVASLFNKPSYSTIVKSVSDCTVITMNKDFISKCIGKETRIAKKYIEFLSERINFLNTKISSFTAKNAENKLYNYLLQLPREDNVINLKVDMSTIAKMIGIGRATLYRAFDKLEQNGTITKKEKIIILNEVD